MSDLILGVNPGHDGAVAILRNGNLELSFESEKDSGFRHAPARSGLLFEVMRGMERPPDVIAFGGWADGGLDYPLGAGYRGMGSDLVRRTPVRMMGSEVELFESTHERSHIFSSFGLSPFPQRQPFYALVWEGQTGGFYEVDRNMEISEIGQVLRYPGYKYSFLFDLADPARSTGSWNHAAAGKLMALASFSDRSAATKKERAIIDAILDTVEPPVTPKGRFRGSPYLNCGVTAPHFKQLAGKFSDALFNRFYAFAKKHLTKRLPLVIGGGCGLNCEWNTRWKNSGLFEDVFFPPVTNDSGSAIGTAIEAQYFRTGSAKIEWNVYCGQEFVDDAESDYYRASPLDPDDLARDLNDGAVVAWVHGRCEIGPRALGHRSVLASPFAARMRNRLNKIKQREPYRPVAPICLEEDAQVLFGLNHPSPYMLEFQKVLTNRLRAVTHVDGSARVQTVNERQNPEIYRLLQSFKRLTGFGVLCNTSLNFPGRGFLNRTSDLFLYVWNSGIEIAAVNGIRYDRRRQ